MTLGSVSGLEQDLPVDYYSGKNSIKQEKNHDKETSINLGINKMGLL